MESAPRRFDKCNREITRPLSGSLGLQTVTDLDPKLLRSVEPVPLLAMASSDPLPAAEGSSGPDPFLSPGASTSTIFASQGWATILKSENLAPTTDATTTQVSNKALGNISIASTNLKHVVFASDRNYDYFLDTYPSGDGWNAAWMGDQYGC